ncbi:MAG TPA: hypothetical protein VGW38_01590, partial [Chloroflexota bacterium]|nr:hypothetical protein [Chloroflexota bacterium]
MTPRLVVTFFASLPLQWQVVAVTPLGVVRWFHLTGLLMCLALSSRNHRDARRRLVRRIRLLAAASVLYSTALVAFSWYNGSAPAEPLQQVFYAITGLFVGVFFVRDQDWATVRYVAPAALVTYLVAFWHSATAAGVDVVGTIRTALVNVNPEAIHFALFRATFGGTEAGGRANVRHEIYAALLVAAYVSVYANHRTPGKGPARAFTFGSVGLIILLVALSLSRAVILAALFVGALGGLRRFLRGRTTAKQAALTAAAMVLLPLAVLSSIPQLMWSRFVTDTASYEGRSSATAAAVEDVMAHPLVGSGDPGISSHNFLLDAAARGGIVTALFALAVFALISWALVKASLRYLQSSSVPLPAIGAAALAVVRMLTAGGGTLHL